MDFYADWQEKHGEPHPDVLRLEPLPRHLERILDVFWSLHPARFNGMGHRPLGIRDILDWCEFREIRSADYKEYLWYFIRRLDQVWLELAEQDRERKRRQDEWLAEIERE